MSKHKIYSKLFEFSDIKSWKSTGINEDKKYYSESYTEYKLEFKKCKYFWQYNVYPNRNSSYNSKKYSDYSDFVGYLVPKFSHKISWTIAPFIAHCVISATIIKPEHFFNINLILSLLIPFILFFGIYPMIFMLKNWKIYKTFFNAKYSNSRYDKIVEIEADAKLNDKINNTINSSLDPKTLRKNKLLNLNKKTSFITRVKNKVKKFKTT